MSSTRGAWRRLRASLAGVALRRARRLRGRPGARRWLALASSLAPRFAAPHRAYLDALHAAGDRLGVLQIAQRAAQRFEKSPDAWMALGEAYLGAYRTRDALVAFERALMIEERPDAAMAAGAIYRQLGDPATAGARFARAYAAGAGPDALRSNADALRAAGDLAAAEQAMRLWEQETGEPA